MFYLRDHVTEFAVSYNRGVAIAQLVLKQLHNSPGIIVSLDGVTISQAFLNGLTSGFGDHVNRVSFQWSTEGTGALVRNAMTEVRRVQAARI